MKTTKNLRPNVAAPVARTTASTSSKGAAVNASWVMPMAPFTGVDASWVMPMAPFTGDGAE